MHRFPIRIRQLEKTYDLVSLTADQLIELLGDEFRQHRHVAAKLRSALELRLATGWPPWPADEGSHAQVVGGHHRDAMPGAPSLGLPSTERGPLSRPMMATRSSRKWSRLTLVARTQLRVSRLRQSRVFRF